MKNWLMGALAVAVLATALPSISEAKRMGGGRSSGMTRDMPARTAPTATPAKPAPNQPAAAPNSAAAAPAAAGAAAAAGKRSWMGPLAGLAAGLGIAALMSHLGMGEAFGNFLMLALLAVAAFFVVRLLMRRFMPKPATASAASTSSARSGAQVAWPQNTERQAMEPLAADQAAPAASSGPALNTEPSSALPATAATAAAAAVAAQPASPSVFVPASFDSEGFTRTAKLIFIRLQAANDTADLEDLRRFSTPELFASLRLDIQERGASAQHTDVQQVDAEVLDVAQEGTDQIVSVRFKGRMVEEKGAAPIDFNEVWHLVKPLDDSRSWAIAGIEQMTV